jgi:hypothetical protein
LTALTFVGVCSAAGGTTDESAIVRRRDAGLDPEPPPLPPPLKEVARLSGRVFGAGVVARSFGDGGAAARGIGNRPRIEPVDVRVRLVDRESGDSPATSGSLSGIWGSRPAARLTARAIGLGNGFADFPGKAKEGGATRERRRSCPSSACSRPLPLSTEEEEEVPVGPNVLVAHRGRFEFELEPGAVLLLTLSPAVGAGR